MKIRTDFVTNSSSSSFILARKGELTDAQKAAIINFVEKNFFGEKILSPESTDEEIAKVIDEEYLEDSEESIRAALKDGKDIYHGWVSFEECEYDIAEMFKDLWDEISKVDDKNFTQIETELSY